MSVDFDAFLGQPKAKILLLGIFHFQDRGLDKYKPQSNFDVFRPQRQKEIKEVVNPANYQAMASGYLAELARMQLEVHDYLNLYLASRLTTLYPGSAGYCPELRIAYEIKSYRKNCLSNEQVSHSHRN